MRIRFIALAIALLGSLTATTCEAVDWHKFWSDFHLVKQRNNAWPQPFIHQDQQTYFNTFNPMIDAGWQVECTLGAHHFDQESNELNDSGVAKLVSILRTVPQDRQQVYVNTDENGATEKRIEAVKAKLAHFRVGSVPVATSTLRPSPMRGKFVETNYGAFQGGLPAPTVRGANIGTANGGN